MSPLSGQVAIVTGGGSGVGLATAEKLIADGAQVVIAGRDAAKLDRARGRLGDRCLAVPTDVTDPAACARLVATTVESLGKLDILINNAGTNLKERTLRELTPETWDAMLAANLSGAFYCIHAALPVMRARGAGIVVNIVSVAGKRGNPLGGAAYVAAKFGMGGLGMVLSNEERDSGVRVSNIYPGEIDTPILDARPQPLTAEHRATILQAEDVAEAVLFVLKLPPRVSVPELVLKPTAQMYF